MLLMTKEYKVPSEPPKVGQVEPEASYWFRSLTLKTVSFEEVRSQLDDTVLNYETNETKLKEDIAKLKDFYERRNEDFDGT